MAAATPVIESGAWARASSSRMSSPLSRAGARYLAGLLVMIFTARVDGRHAGRLSCIGEARFYIYNATNHKLVSGASRRRASFKDPPVLIVIPESRSDIRDPAPSNHQEDTGFPSRE